ncbi:MAG: mannose-1-phosphate guanylyltransferase [Caldilineae bacterium]|nr:MAG: mannose-1-phosphate guanylyltransferase [Caldilineae bacterium]
MTKMSGTHLYPVILAGGIGSRLWPRSRKSTPKQFLDLTGNGRSMLQEAYDRMVPLVPKEHIFVITNAEYVELVRAQLPDLPGDNIVGEPAARGSAAAIGLAALHLRREDPDAIMAVLTADHLIRKPEALRQVLIGAAELAQQGELITLGIQPTYPETGYGYIEMDLPLGVYNDCEARRVRCFREKPDRATAEAFLAAGNYVWNSGMFVWRQDAIMEEFRRQMPQLYTALEGLAPALGSTREQEAYERYWMPLKGNVTIDYGVMEGARSVAVFPVDLGWDDIGSWAALLDVLPKDEAGNVCHARHVHHESSNVLVFSHKRLIATIGLRDMIVVDTDDAILVMPADRAQDVKTIIEQIKKQGLDHYLE